MVGGFSLGVDDYVEPSGGPMYAGAAPGAVPMAPVPRMVAPSGKGAVASPLTPILNSPEVERLAISMGLKPDDPSLAVYKAMAEGLRPAAPERPSWKDALGAGIASFGNVLINTSRAGTADVTAPFNRLYARDEAARNGYAAQLQQLRQVLVPQIANARLSQIERQRQDAEKAKLVALFQRGRPPQIGGQGQPAMGISVPQLPQGAALPHPITPASAPGIAVGPPGAPQETPQANPMQPGYGAMSQPPQVPAFQRSIASGGPAGSPTPGPAEAAPPGGASPTGANVTAKYPGLQFQPAYTSDQILAAAVLSGDMKAVNDVMMATNKHELEVAKLQLEQMSKRAELSPEQAAALEGAKKLASERAKKAVEIEHAQRMATMGGKGMQAGIERLAAIPDRVGVGAFERTIGPFDQWAPYGVRIGPAVSYLTTLMSDYGSGEISKMITGELKGMMVKVKEAVRGPGEGVWTDKDQENLEAIAGDLLTARDRKAYDRLVAGLGERLYEIYLAPKGVKREDIGLRQPRSDGTLPAKPKPGTPTAPTAITPDMHREMVRRYQNADEATRARMVQSLIAKGIDPKILAQQPPARPDTQEVDPMYDLRTMGGF